MRKHLALMVVGLLALGGAGLALAEGADGNRSVTAVSGTFTATTTSGTTKTRTCTTTDGKTITSTRSTYTGAASGLPDLTGALTIDTSSVINTTDAIGVVDARLRIAAAGGKTDLRFTGV